MPKLAANLSLLFTELPFLDRFEAAAAAGFTGVEFLFPYAHPAAEIAQRLRAHGLTQALFNAPPGDWDAGERGIAALPGREPEFRSGIELALEYAAALGCPRLHVMAGIAPNDDPRAAAAYRENVRHAAESAARRGVEILLEPINRRDMPGYFMWSIPQALAAIDDLRLENVRLQLDLYHAQVTEGDLARKIRDLAGRYAHVQIAGNPDRHEPDEGEIDYHYLLALLDAAGYTGWVGCEYRPRAGTLAGLGWAQRYGVRPRTPAAP